jgi:hypothetical protein
MASSARVASSLLGLKLKFFGELLVNLEYINCKVRFYLCTQHFSEMVVTNMERRIKW